MILPIVAYGHPILRKVAHQVDESFPDLFKLVEDMWETMYASSGVGLAAPQVNRELRLFVMDCDGLKLVAANPEIVSAEGEQAGEEGCLSVGKVHAPLKRAARVTLRAQDVNGEWYERTAEGLAARCFLHETDHCDGLLFIDHLTPLRRDMVKRRFQKLRKWR